MQSCLRSHSCLVPWEGKKLRAKSFRQIAIMGQDHTGVGRTANRPPLQANQHAIQAHSSRATASCRTPPASYPSVVPRGDTAKFNMVYIYPFGTRLVPSWLFGRALCLKTREQGTKHALGSSSGTRLPSCSIAYLAPWTRNVSPMGTLTPGIDRLQSSILPHERNVEYLAQKHFHQWTCSR